jgi:ATP-binding cassette subfamily G (WHITE) protein 2 (SNQ2)
MWLYIMVFELFYLGFGQAIAAFAPNELLASLLVPVFFLFVVSFCGIVVPFRALPYFWRRYVFQLLRPSPGLNANSILSWMYYLSPFTYLLEGMLSLVVHNVPIICSTKELAIFSAPPNQSCQAYAGDFAQQSGGYVQTQPDGQCGYCQYSTGDAFAAGFNVYYRNLWRDFGFFWAYILFNFAVVFVASWFYLKGGKSIKGLLRKKKAMRIKNKSSPE